MASVETWYCTKLCISLSDGTVVSTTGQVNFEQTGKVELVAVFSGPRFFEDFASPQNIAGETDGGFLVAANGSVVTQASFDSNTGVSHVSFVFIYCDMVKPGPVSWTRQEVYLKGINIFGSARVTLDASTCTIRPLPMAPNDRRPGLVRAVLFVESPRTSSHTDHLALIYLLSLAQRCQIRSPFSKYFDGDKLVRLRLVPQEGPSVATNPLIPRSSVELAGFLHQTLPVFAARDAEFQLHRLIEYYCLSVAAPYGEVKFILASVLMEAFKFYWALNVGKKQTDIKANGQVRGFVKSKPAKGRPVYYGFKELLTEACNSLGYSPTFSFIEDRNALFHSGAPGTHQSGAAGTWAAIEPELVLLYRQIDDILLLILGYKGPIHRWDDPDNEEIFK